MRIDDPINCLTVHGLTGIWGTFSNGLFATPARAAFQANNSIQGGFYLRPSEILDPLDRPAGHQLGIQIAGILATIFYVYTLSTIVFLLIHFTVGLRAPAEHEEAGLDISEHGAFGYPERFIKVNGVDAHLPLSAPSHEEMKVRARGVRGGWRASFVASSLSLPEALLAPWGVGDGQLTLQGALALGPLECGAARSLTGRRARNVWAGRAGFDSLPIVIPLDSAVTAMGGTPYSYAATFPPSPGPTHSIHTLPSPPQGQSKKASEQQSSDSVASHPVFSAPRV